MYQKALAKQVLLFSNICFVKGSHIALIYRESVPDKNFYRCCNAFRQSYLVFMETRIGDPKKLEVGFLQFIKDKMNVTLYRMNENGTNTEINLNTAGTDTVETNCPI